MQISRSFNLIFIANGHPGNDFSNKEASAISPQRSARMQHLSHHKGLLGLEADQGLNADG
jgi:hypothetical protein